MTNDKENADRGGLKKPEARVCATRPDLSQARLVDPASYEPTQSQEDALPKKIAEPKKFNFELSCDEAERKFGADRYYGTANNSLDSSQKFYWSVACLDKATSDCIPGTNMSELSVTVVGGQTLLEFEQGQWLVSPVDELATAIQDELIQEYANRREEQAAPVMAEHATEPGLSQAKSGDLEAGSNQDEAAFAARVAEIEAEQAAREQDKSHDTGGGMQR